jgi:dolichol-phosphate mannosyltransferase
MSRTLVIVPTYNEAENVGPLSVAIWAACPDADLLFVDDSSPDGTGVRIDGMVRQEPRLHVLHREAKSGLGRAYVAGFRWALERDYDFIFEMDADFSHRPQDIPRLLEAAEQADVAIGSRYIGGVRVVNWPLHRLLLSKGAALYARLLTGLPVHDPTSGFKCYRRAVLERIDTDSLHSNGYSFQIETLHRAWMLGFRLQEVPIVFEDRMVGVSKMHAGIVREALWMVWQLWARCGFRRKPGRTNPAVPPAAGGGS